MKKYKASLIISIYKNIPFLNAVLESIKYQTERDFEIIISEDGNNTDVFNFVKNYPFQNDYKHLTQEDIGWRKNKALNNAVSASASDWIIFIDGDSVLHPRFIEMHLRYANKNLILAGKRVKLNQQLTNFLIECPDNVLKMQSKIWQYFVCLRDKPEFPEEGIFIPPNGFLSFIPKIRTQKELRGCNMSFSKSAIESINGFDEDYILPAVGEDADLSWRFEAAGFKHFSLRNLAVQYHLNHPENWHDQSVNLAIMEKRKNNNTFICANGIHKISL